MEYRQRRLVAAAILVISLLIVAYLVFFSPSESEITVPTATIISNLPFTPLPSTAETDDKRTAEAAAVQSELTPESDDDTSDDDGDARAMAPIPDWMNRVQSAPVNASCPAAAVREIAVSNSEQLTAALQSALPGDRISLADGGYSGNFELAMSGVQGKMIWLCGSRNAILDAGGPKNGYGLHITGSFTGVWGITVSNAQKGIVIDGADFVEIDNVDVHTTGDEGIHFRGNATDGVVQDSLIHHTGLRRATFGEGIYIGSAIANWPEYSDGEADKSDRSRISRNQIWDTTAEAIDIKEGTSGGTIDFNTFDGGGLVEADSWIDVKGNDYTILSNVGVTSPEDGFQTHNINDMGSGSNNVFIANTAQVDGAGYGFYIHDPDKTNNVVSCTNIVSKAASGMSNISCSEPG